MYRQKTLSKSSSNRFSRRTSAPRPVWTFRSTLLEHIRCVFLAFWVTPCPDQLRTSIPVPAMHTSVRVRGFRYSAQYTHASMQYVPSYHVPKSISSTEEQHNILPACKIIFSYIFFPRFLVSFQTGIGCAVYVVICVHIEEKIKTKIKSNKVEIFVCTYDSAPLNTYYDIIHTI